ncbi:MAG: SPOR domain-containing protein, partial [Burkholderiales bacterium]
AVATQPAASTAPPAEAASVSDGSSRFVVQVGAFADPASAREVRLKMEKLGMKTYTQVAETSAGKRIRVRLGPFATRAEADKAQAKSKEAGIAAVVLTL